MSSKYRSGFRKGHSCQSLLLNLLEKCKLAIDSNHVYGILLTDLFKALDCLPYQLVAYGLNSDSCKLLMSYFANRKQRVKVGNGKSEWLGTETNAPQGCVLGPYLFNNFQNDLICLLGKSCDVFNYADDDTVVAAGKDKEQVCVSLKESSDIMVDWFNAGQPK